MRQFTLALFLLVSTSSAWAQPVPAASPAPEETKKAKRPFFHLHLGTFAEQPERKPFDVSVLMRSLHESDSFASRLNTYGAGYLNPPSDKPGSATIIISNSETALAYAITSGIQYSAGDRYPFYGHRGGRMQTSGIPLVSSLDLGRDRLRLRLGYGQLHSQNLQITEEVEFLETVKAETVSFDPQSKYGLWKLTLGRGAEAGTYNINFFPAYAELGLLCELDNWQKADIRISASVEGWMLRRTLSGIVETFRYSKFAPELKSPGVPVKNFRQSTGEKTLRDTSSEYMLAAPAGIEVELRPISWIGIFAQGKYYFRPVKLTIDTPSIWGKFPYTLELKPYTITAGITLSFF